MNKWAIRALGGAACTAGFLAFGLGIASADEPNHPSGSTDISAKNPLASATSGPGEAVRSALHSTNSRTAADRHGGLEIKIKLGERADHAPATPSTGAHTGSAATRQGAADPSAPTATRHHADRNAADRMQADRPATRAAHKAPAALKITVRLGAAHESSHGHRQPGVDQARAQHPVHKPGGTPSRPADGHGAEPARDAGRGPIHPLTKPVDHTVHGSTGLVADRPRNGVGDLVDNLTDDTTVDDATGLVDQASHDTTTTLDDLTGGSDDPGVDVSDLLGHTTDNAGTTVGDLTGQTGNPGTEDGLLPGLEDGLTDDGLVDAGTLPGDAVPGTAFPGLVDDLVGNGLELINDTDGRDAAVAGLIDDLTDDTTVDDATGLIANTVGNATTTVDDLGGDGTGKVGDDLGQLVGDLVQGAGTTAGDLTGQTGRPGTEDGVIPGLVDGLTDDLPATIPGGGTPGNGGDNPGNGGGTGDNGTGDNGDGDNGTGDNDNGTGDNDNGTGTGDNGVTDAIGMAGFHGDDHNSATPADTGPQGVHSAEATAAFGNDDTGGMRGGASSQAGSSGRLAGTGADAGLGALGAAGLLALLGGLVLTTRRRHN